MDDRRDNGYDPDAARRALKSVKKQIEEQHGPLSAKDDMEAVARFDPDSGRYRCYVGEHMVMVMV